MIPGPSPAAGRLVVIADVLVDGTGAPAMTRPSVQVVDGRIVDVSVRSDDWAAPTGWEVVDGTGSTLLPGLIDAHAHLGFPEPGEAISEGELAAGAVARAGAALVGGVTTIRDLGSAFGIALRLRDDVAAGRIIGPRILAAGPPITITGGHCDWFGQLADTPAELLAAMDRLAGMGVDVVKVMATGGMASRRSDPWTPQYLLESLAPAVERAHRHGLRVAAHALCTAGVRIAAGAGVDTIEHGWTITGRRQDFEPSIVDDVVRSGSFASVTTHDALRDLLPGPATEGDVDEIRRRLAPHRELAAAGVPMVVHSDAGPGPTRFDDFAASVRCYALGMDVTPVEAIRAATGIPATALGLDGMLGMVRVGAVADLLLVDGDASADMPTRDRISRVLLGGRTVARNGRLVS